MAKIDLDAAYNVGMAQSNEKTAAKKKKMMAIKIDDDE